MGYWVEQAGIHILAVLAARYRIFGMYPFVVPFFMAAYLQEKSSVSLFLVLMLGLFSRFEWAASLRYALIILFLLILLKNTDRKKIFADSIQIALASGVVLCSITMPYQYVITGEDVSLVYALLEGVIAGCFTLVFERGLEGFRAGINQIFARQAPASPNFLIQEATRSRIENFGQAFLTMEKMLSLNEQERKDSIPNGLSNMYLSGDGISLLNAVESQSNRLADMRMNFIRQLGRIGSIITTFQSELAEQSVGMDYFEERIRERLFSIGIRVSNAIPLQGVNGHLEVYMSCKAMSNVVVNGEQLAKIVGKTLGTAVVCLEKSESIVGRQDELFSFVEKGKYMLTTGVVRRNRTGEQVCGDNFSVIKLDNQKAVFMISDGMGFGESAYGKSGQVIELLEQLLSAGFCRDLAIELMNSFVSFLTEGNLSTTLDLAVIDMYTGDTDFIKLGASTTFIRRKGKVEYIRSVSLPVGILEQVEFDTCERKLYHGDMIIMVSDGILDGIMFENKEAYLAELIAETGTNNAQVMAETILEKVETMRAGNMRDDSTVLVAGLWEN